MSVYWPSPGVSLRMSLVRTKLRNSAADAPLTVTSPMCEMSKIPAALRTARCSSVMLVYCTGISQPPKSMSFAPSFWCAEKSAERFNMTGSTTGPSAPLLRLHLFFRHMQIVDDQVFGKFDERIRAARVKNRVRQVRDNFPDPLVRDAAGAAGPVVLRLHPRAGDVKFEVGILLFQLAEFGVENDVGGRAHAVKHGDFGIQLPARGLARERTEWGHARTAGDADQVLVRLVNRQEFSDRGEA